MAHSKQTPRSRGQSRPPGRTKIVEALKSLLGEKEFTAITTADIAQTAGVTEALIYKYFSDKRDLLHQLLAEYLDYFVTRAELDVKGIKGAVHKLRRLIWSHINMYAGNRVFARILLLEVRNYREYFNSDAYQMVKRYSSFLESIVEEGIAEGVIRDDIPIPVIRQLIIGGIEHICLPAVIFNRDIDPDAPADQLCDLILDGISTRQP
ncbi:MAG: TetR/AcrR family transcriptional regulator [Desulfomonilaceae bacterium]|nr:TetR/AcrR family transcriptional regulator [Desulfomonilaceae bacterium]